MYVIESQRKNNSCYKSGVENQQKIYLLYLMERDESKLQVHAIEMGKRLLLSPPSVFPFNSLISR